MKDMFREATAFNQPIGSWDIKRIKNKSQLPLSLRLKRLAARDRRFKK